MILDIVKKTEIFLAGGVFKTESSISSDNFCEISSQLQHIFIPKGCFKHNWENMIDWTVLK